MVKKMKSLLILQVAVALLMLPLVGCAVEKTQEGEMPEVEVDVKEGQLPKYDVETAEVTVGTEEATIKVPDVDVDVKTEEKKIQVPDVDVKMPNEKGDDEDGDGDS